MSLEDLSDNELAYEAHLRNIDINLPVASIKRSLRVKMRDERGDEMIYIASEIPFEEDFDICIAKYDKLVQLLNIANTNMDTRMYNRLVSRVIHLKHRVARILHFCPENLRSDVNNFYIKVRSLLYEKEISSEEESVISVPPPTPAVTDVDPMSSARALYVSPGVAVIPSTSQSSRVPICMMGVQSTVRKFYNLNPAVNETRQSNDQSIHIDQRFAAINNTRTPFANITFAPEFAEMTDIDYVCNVRSVQMDPRTAVDDQVGRRNTGAIPRRSQSSDRDENRTFAVETIEKQNQVQPARQMSYGRQDVVEMGSDDSGTNQSFSHGRTKATNVVPRQSVKPPTDHRFLSRSVARDERPQRFSLPTSQEMTKSKVHFVPTVESQVHPRTTTQQWGAYMDRQHFEGHITTKLPVSSFDPSVQPPTCQQNSIPSNQPQRQISNPFRRTSESPRVSHPPVQENPNHHQQFNQQYQSESINPDRWQTPSFSSNKPPDRPIIFNEIPLGQEREVHHRPANVSTTWTNCSHSSVPHQEHIVPATAANSSSNGYNVFSRERSHPNQVQDTFCDRIDALHLDSTPTILNSHVNVPRRINSIASENGRRSERKSIPVIQWNLKFSGDGGDPMSISEFLDRVNFYGRARNVTSEELLYSAYDLFSGSALIWYRANYSRFNTWEELERELRSIFLPYEYEFYLWREIEDRTQGAEERFGIYLACMQNLFNKLSEQPSEEKRLSVVMRNLQPYYTERLCFKRIATLRELSALCGEIEENRARVARFKPPPSTRYGSLLEPAFAYKHRQIQKINCCDYVHEHAHTDEDEICEIAGDRAPINSGAFRDPKKIRCYNCQQLGHWSKECTNPKTMRNNCKTCGQKWPVKQEKVVCEVECEDENCHEVGNGAAVGQ